MTWLTIGVWALLCTACATSPEQDSGIPTDTTTLVASGNHMAMAAAPLTTGCFRYLAAGDTLLLRITAINGPEVLGNLERRKKGGEPQLGAVLGGMQGDTLFANFSYLEKGERLVREVAFLRRGTGWVEGAGPTTGRDAVRSFSNHSKLDFSQLKYLPYSCE